MVLGGVGVVVGAGVCVGIGVGGYVGIAVNICHENQSSNLFGRVTMNRKYNGQVSNRALRIARLPHD